MIALRFLVIDYDYDYSIMIMTMIITLIMKKKLLSRYFLNNLQVRKLTNS